MKLPLHIADDAQGPCAIMDANGKAVCMFTDIFRPLNGFCWEPSSSPSPDPDTDAGKTFYAKRNAAVRAVFDLLSKPD